MRLISRLLKGLHPQIRLPISRPERIALLDCMHICAYNRHELRLGSTQAKRNFEKHGVDFADAALALEDALALTIRDPDAMTEERFITLGADPFGRLLAVAYT